MSSELEQTVRKNKQIYNESLIISLEHDAKKHRALYNYIYEQFEGAFPSWAPVLGNIRLQQDNRLEAIKEIENKIAEIKNEFETNSKSNI